MACPLEGIVRCVASHKATELRRAAYNDISASSRTMIHQGLQRVLLRLLPLVVLMVLSLTPSILLYYLFGSLNSAVFDQLPIKLGGPIAFFFAFFLKLGGMYRDSVKDDNDSARRLDPMLGNWTINSRSAISGKQASSETMIENDDGELSMKGGTFFLIEQNGSRGLAIGDWTVDMAVTDGRRLQYVYTLNDMTNHGRVWKGFVSVTLVSERRPLLLEGVWQVFGSEYHNGTIQLCKNILPKR